MLPTGCFWAVVDDGRDEAVEENADADKRRLAVTKTASADAMEVMVATGVLWLACWCLRARIPVLVCGLLRALSGPKSSSVDGVDVAFVPCGYVRRPTSLESVVSRSLAQSDDDVSNRDTIGT